jgi:16S rRNA (guanine527-N7)-methyltransferase
MVSKILPFSVPHETLAKLETFEKLVHQWQKAINLVSPASLNECWQRHIIDSAQIFPLMPHLSQGGHLIDLGSGAGFPGLVLAVLLPSNWKITLIESDQRKAIFLRETARQLGCTNVLVLAERLEKSNPLKADVVTARALAALPQLWAWVQPLLAPNGMAVFPKGCNWQTELAATVLTSPWQAMPHPSVTDPEAQIIVISST